MGMTQAGGCPICFHSPFLLSHALDGSSYYLFSWSWMNFPKRLLLLFLSVHAFPKDHICVYTHSPRFADFS